ncbi:AAEL009213-PA [Aedes aegypti]|uniref:AAEL009213-PA n=1 Tax=Aedes aegypti TaxID=7159 RepID=Q16WI8_AEDAE|nr:AAEL009213-PA [Aedes aegypti]
MHDLFTTVLSKRDLSRAGELFSVADLEIVNDLSEVLEEISSIISHEDYLQNSNDQSVIEICINRVTSCIKKTNTIEKHCSGLVGLLETCLKYNLQPSKKEADPPHAKISSDIISSIFLNYNKKHVMEVTLPVAVKFLNKGNLELSRNLASYLSSAAIEYSYLLSPHVKLILESLLNGNYGLCHVLSQIYDAAPEPINAEAKRFVEIIPKCELQEQIVILQLLVAVAKSKPSSLLDSIPQLFDLAQKPSISTAVMLVILKLAEYKPIKMSEYTDSVRNVAQTVPQTVGFAAQILSAIGKSSKDRAQVALDFVLEYLPKADRALQTILLNEATKLCTKYPVLFTDKVTSVVRQRRLNNGNQIKQTPGGVTIVNLNSSAMLPTPNVAVISNSGATTANTTIINTSNGTTTTSAIHPALLTNFMNSANGIPAVVNGGPMVPPTPPHTGYTRRAKLGDSRSTGRLHAGGGGNKSMTRLNIAGGSVGGLHKSMTRLSSSQLLGHAGGGSNSNSNILNSHSSGNVFANKNNSTQNFASPVPPPLSQHVMITGENKWGIPQTKITSGGVTVTTSPTRAQRPYSQGPNTLMGSAGALGKNSLGGLNQSTGSIGMVQVHHASPASPTMFNNHSQQTSPQLTTLSLNSNEDANNQVSVSGPATVTSRRNDNRSVTLLNASSAVNQRMSVFEPYPMRDTIQHFCEKHLDKIKAFTESVAQRLPPPAKCIIEERRAKKMAKLHFACQVRGPHCLYSRTMFTMRTRNPRTWIHLMFLDLQARAPQNALSSWDPSVSRLKHCWDTLKCENKTFITLVTSAFPNVKEQEALINELRNAGFFDVFELGAASTPEGTSSEDLQFQWGCFLCNHPEKAMGFLHGNTQPVIEGQLKEKKGKWRLFRRWRTRYFTLSGAHLSCKGSTGGESIDVNQIRSVKVSRGARNIPKAFEIFTGDQTLILKPKDGNKAEEWVQCLSIVLAHSQARDSPTTRTNSLPARSLGNSRNVF